MKKIVSIAVSFALVLSVTMSNIQVTAADTSSDYKYKISYSKAIITDYKGSGTVIVIPSKLGGYPVVGIGDSAFEYNEKITSVTIPKGVKGIASYAFSECRSLTVVKLPSTLETIQESAFEGCIMLTGITLPSSLLEIGDYAFNVCQKLTSITIPGAVVKFGYCVFENCDALTRILVGATSTVFSSVDGVLLNKAGTEIIKYPEGRPDASYTISSSVTRIRNSAFYDSDFVTQIIIPESVTEIQNYSFGKCSKLTDINIPENTTIIPSGLFSMSTALQTVVIPNNVKAIQDYAFSGCTSLTSIIIPDTVATLGYSVFSDCKSLTSITLPNAITKIEEELFSGCTSLENIVIPESVKSIEYDAFYKCSKLAEINIPKAITDIMTSSFDMCASLTAINVDPDNANYSSIDGVLFNKTQEELIQYPAGKTGIYNIPSSVLTIGYSAFSNCLNLTEITIPSNIYKIEEYAFYNCKNITSITFLEGVRTINDGAFYGCTALTTIMLPKSLKTIGVQIVGGCTLLTNIGVNSENAYYSSVDGVLFNKDKSNLIQYPNGIIGKYVVPSATTSIDSYAFYKCINLTGITFSNNLKSIGYSVFEDCTGLTYIEIPKSVNQILDAAFYNCKNLKTAYFLGNAPSMGYVVFYGCSKLFKINYIYGNRGFTVKWKGYKTNAIIPKPTVNVVKSGAKSIKISWSKFRYASGYKVYRSTSKNGTYKVIKTTVGTSYLDSGLTGGKTYYYKVRVFRTFSATKHLYSAYSTVKSQQL